MTDQAHTLAVAVAELGALSAALPRLLTPIHPRLPVLTGALDDVASGLFTAVCASVDDRPADAKHSAGTQLRALRATQQLAAGTPMDADSSATLDEALDLICGLVKIASRHGTTPCP